nr:MAG: hypothetical protein BECKTC1821E_GA0114239_103025 [Candidatus Kentron sp. TC]
MKLLVSATIPALILYFGYQLNSDLETKQAERIALERVVEWRFEQFKELSALVNDMYVYYIHVGKWKEFTPLDIVEKKREVDKIIYAMGSIFSEEMKRKYNLLIGEMFSTYQGWGEDARLRTSITYRREAARKSRIEWDTNWDKRFIEEDNRTKIKNAYKAFTSQLADDLNIPRSREFLI